MKLSIQSAAETDILPQVDWYAEKGLVDVARRFRAAVSQAIQALVATPAAGAPRHFDNPKLAGLRAWRVGGFDDFKIYYLVQPELLTVIRVLHGRRDIEAILESRDLGRPGLS